MNILSLLISDFQFDLVGVLLGLLVILIFIAIFTLLRQINSPFIKRFELMVNAKMTRMANPPGSYMIHFQSEGREFELLEINYEQADDRKSKFIFLTGRSKVFDYSLCFRDVLIELRIKNILEEIFPQEASLYLVQMSPGEVPQALSDFKVLTTNPDLTKAFLNNPNARAEITGFRINISGVGSILPVGVRGGVVYLDYSLSEHHLSELIANPRNLKKHIQRLNTLITELEQLK